MAAFRLTMYGKLLDSVQFDAESEDGPSMIADSFLGNYQHDLFQLVIVDINQKKKKQQR